MLGYGAQIVSTKQPTSNMRKFHNGGIRHNLSKVYKQECSQQSGRLGGWRGGKGRGAWGMGRKCAASVENVRVLVRILKLTNRAYIVTGRIRALRDTREMRDVARRYVRVNERKSS